MKNLLLILLMCLGLTACEKEDPAPTKGKVVFFMTPNSASWNLLVDGVDRGELSHTFVPPTCGDAGFITLNLTIGTHTYDVKSNDGLAWGDPKEFKAKATCQVIEAIY